MMDELIKTVYEIASGLLVVVFLTRDTDRWAIQQPRIPLYISSYLSFRQEHRIIRLGGHHLSTKKGFVRTKKHAYAFN